MRRVEIAKQRAVAPGETAGRAAPAQGADQAERVEPRIDVPPRAPGVAVASLDAKQPEVVAAAGQRADTDYPERLTREQVAALTAAGVSAEEARLFLALAGVTPQLLMAIKAVNEERTMEFGRLLIGMSPVERELHLRCCGPESDFYLGEGFSRAEMLHYLRSGGQAADVQRFQALRYEAGEMIAWREAGRDVHTAERVARMATEAGLEPELLRAFLARPGMTLQRLIEMMPRLTHMAADDEVDMSSLEMEFRIAGSAERDRLIQALSPATDGLRAMGCELRDIVSLLRSGISQDDVAELIARGHSRRWVGEFAAFGGTLEYAARLERSGFSAAQILECAQVGASLETVAHYQRQRLDQGTIVELVREYRRLGIASNEATYASALPLLGTQTRLGSGKFNIVFSAQYEWLDGRVEEAVFKPLAAPDFLRQHRVDRSAVGPQTGVDSYDPKFAERNLACAAVERFGHEVAQSLGVRSMPSVYPKVGLGLGGDPRRLGLVMELIRGAPAGQLPPSSLGDSEYRRQTTWLQIWDQILGQSDRHARNYLVGADAAGALRVVGVDNDQCCGTTTDPRALMQGADRTRHGFRGVGLAPLIDRDMARLIAALDATRLGQLVGSYIPGAADAAMARLQVLKEHVATCERLGNVIEVSEWSGAKAIVVTSVDYRTVSYAAREISHALGD